MSKRISRATFLRGLGVCGLAAITGEVIWQWYHSSPRFPCRMLGPSREVGHRLRRNELKPVAAGPETKRTKVAIIGGGIAGLSAGWWLKRSGCSDFVILELEKDVGGNSSSGSNAYGSYPWGAHYVPVANPESQYVNDLFEELGIIQKRDQAGLPFYNELYLCHEPQERLFKDGAFHDGLVPHRGLQPAENADIERFFSLVKQLRAARGSDGKPAFAIPVDLSSQDEQFLKLDRLSMKDWMEQNNFKTKPLEWYVNYCCRDDYGSTLDHVSAWAGLHYFAGRRGRAANAEQNSVVTWPQGNGFLVEKLKELLKDHIRPQSLVYAVTNDDGGNVVASYVDIKSQQPAAISASHAIIAAPRFVARHILPNVADCSELQYAPWMVANISISRIPACRGVPISWDNVSYYSESLGYVTANHQDITTREKAFVITYYYPLSQLAPVQSRQQLYSDTAEKWSDIIVRDLEQIHPGITEDILAMDLWPWGHGMIRPSVGFIWGEQRLRMKEPVGQVFFAHSDMSGMSNFEEAQYHGVQAAKAALARSAG